MLAYMDASTPADQRQVSKDQVEEVVHEFANRFGATFKQAWDEIKSWYQCDELNRSEQLQEGTK